MFSVLNSEVQQQANNPYTLFVPKYINITAGEPFTFVASIMGGTASLNNVTIVYNELLGIDIQATS